MPTWPLTLPQSPLLASYAEQAGENWVENRPDAGPPKRRRRYTTRIDQLRAAYVMTPTQLDIFATFLRDDLADGAVPCSVPHPRTGSTVSALLSNVQWQRDGDANEWLVGVQMTVLTLAGATLGSTEAPSVPGLVPTIAAVAINAYLPAVTEADIAAGLRVWVENLNGSGQGALVQAYQVAPAGTDSGWARISALT